MLTIDADDLSPATELDLFAAPPRPWTAKARCNDGAGTLAHLFFSEDLYDIARAKAICGRCPVSDRCLTEALQRAEPWGVWGGELLLNGRVVVGKRPRGRPPRQSRPELVVDEVPLPPGYREARSA